MNAEQLAEFFSPLKRTLAMRQGLKSLAGKWAGAEFQLLIIQPPYHAHTHWCLTPDATI
jgi:hypothetical protein